MLFWIKQFIKRCRVRCAYPRVLLKRAADVSMESVFEGAACIGNHTRFDGTMGRCSYIGDFGNLNRAKIGRYTSIAAHVRICAGAHPLNMASTSPVFYSLQKQCGVTYVKKQAFNEFPGTEDGFAVNIGSDVWIGDGASIFEGVTVGDGAVVAASAVVTKNVEPYTIVGGVPAKVIGRRFDEETAKQLLQSRWWEHPTEGANDACTGRCIHL